MLIVRRCRNAAELMERAADLFAYAAFVTLSQGRRVRVALSGGGTPRPVYERLASASLRRLIDWGRVDLALGDERAVASHDDLSNVPMIRESLLHPLGLSDDALLHPQGERGEAAAPLFEQLLHERMGEDPFDIVFLGMGADGHTAALFPGLMPPPRAQRALVIASPRPDQARLGITLSLPAIAAARLRITLVTGAGKAEALRRVLSGEDLPAGRALLGTSQGVSLLFADEAALSRWRPR